MSRRNISRKNFPSADHHANKVLLAWELVHYQHWNDFTNGRLGESTAILAQVSPQKKTFY